MSLKEIVFELANSIANDDYRRIVLDILSNPVLTFSSTKPLIAFEDSPAAPRKHHLFSGGLLIHTISVALVAKCIANTFKNIYGVDIDIDLVIAGAILHDIFKYYQYTPDSLNGGYKPREDWYLSHDYAIVAELSRRGAPEALIRVVSEAHGLAPFSTIEGLVLHLADSVDARFGEYIQNVLISKLRDIEKEGCNIYKVLDGLVKAIGIKNLLKELKEDKENVMRRAVDMCKSLK
ncbi:MAG: HD domain-containing protein [Ignisphaera sp.]